jgi:hypothetical protein
MITGTDLLKVSPESLFAQNSICHDFGGDASGEVFHRFSTAPK